MRDKSIHLYTLKNQVDKVKNYLNKGGEVDAFGEYNSTPLHYACREGNIEIVKLLLDFGADIDAKNSYSTIYPIFDTLSSKKLDNTLLIIELLIDKGADKDVVDSFGNTLLHQAIEKESMELIEYFIQLGCDVNATERHDKDTPLHYACLQNNREMVDYLIINGADKEKLNLYNRTAESYLL
jgi:ankyrin repeat protein